MSNKEVITDFYNAFACGDFQTMQQHYHDDIIFEDPAFGQLKGMEAKKMWQMLVERSGGKINVQFSDVKAGQHSGSAHWEAQYIFRQTGRKVHNRIDASFEFKDGKIYRHSDHFNLWKWSRQALGFSGFLIGFTGVFRNKLQQQTRKLLKQYMANENNS
jgi:ketosteroid isomerase-like protein